MIKFFLFCFFNPPADGKKQSLSSHTCTYQIHVCQSNPTLLALLLPGARIEIDDPSEVSNIHSDY